MGWWVVINQVGTLLLFQIDLIVVNLLFGATSAGEYSIILQWGLLLRSLAFTLAAVLVPTILTYYSLKQTENLIITTRSAVKLVGLTMALPVGLICGFSSQLLTIWVGTDYTNLAPLLVLLTAHLAINMSVQPLFSVNVAYNRVRVPGLVTMLLGTINLLLAIGIPLVTGWGYYGVAMAGIIALTLRNSLFIPWYTARILNIQTTVYLRALFPGALAAIFIGVVATGTTSVALPLVPMLIIAGVLISLMYGAIVLGLGLTTAEKHLFRSYLPHRWTNLIGRVNRQ